MLKSLPVKSEGITLRLWTREDTEIRASWPSYPKEYAAFNFALSNSTEKERDLHYINRHKDPNRIDLAVDHVCQKTIGLITLQNIDWNGAIVRNIGMRIHPEWCDKGIGTFALNLLGEWCLKFGIKSIRLDVGAANIRALHCYQKVGFQKENMFWRDDYGLQNANLQENQYDHVREYYRNTNGTPQVQFWWMKWDLENKAQGGRTYQ